MHVPMLFVWIGCFCIGWTLGDLLTWLTKERYRR